METEMRGKRTFMAGIIAGFASPATIAGKANYPQLQGSDISRMRQDVQRIGNDFHTAVKREYVKAKASNKQSA